MKITIRPIKNVPNLFVLYENEQSVIDIDAHTTGLAREHKKRLLRDLMEICRAVETDGAEAFKRFVDGDILAKLNKDEKAAKLGTLWEVRSNQHPGRIIFVFEDPNSIVVSAVNKGTKKKQESPQTQAINRGVNRWQTLSSNLKKKT